ncbi:MAG: aminotransferase class III-fold pyridoxal phosphate-dependent enzyme, partial [Colwellia sp.]
LQQDKLEENVQKQAARMFAGLNRLKDKYEFVGDVRGLGLYIGVELVKSKVNKEPATELAKWAIEALKQRFILLNTNGYDNNIIKIKPALTIDEDDVDRLVDTLDEVFALVDHIS